MAIQFSCASCKKKFKAAEKLAGKTVPCPSCKAKVSIPGLALPAQEAKNGSLAKPGASAEEIAALALAGEEQSQAGLVLTAIEFACPFCDEKQSVAPVLAGKQTPCSSCRRIIKVPIPEKKDGPEWKQPQVKRPAGAVLPKAPAVEGAWDSALGQVSDEALFESGAIVEEFEPLTIGEKLTRVGLGLVLLAAAGFGYLWFTSSRDQSFDDSKVSQIEEKIAKDSFQGLSPAGKALLASDISLYKVRGSVEPSAAKARRLLLSGMQGLKDKPQAQSGIDHDFALLAICKAAMSLGGTDAQAREGSRLKWDDVQKLIRQALDQMFLFELRMLGTREMARDLIGAGQAERVIPLVSQIQSGLQSQGNKKVDESAELFAIAGLELLQGKKPDLAKQVIETINARYATSQVKLPSTAAALLAFALQKEKELPKFQLDEMENAIVNLSLAVQAGKTADGLKPNALPRDSADQFICLAKTGFYSTLIGKNDSLLNQKIAEVMEMERALSVLEAQKAALLLSAIGGELKLPPLNWAKAAEKMDPQNPNAKMVKPVIVFKGMVIEKGKGAESLESAAKIEKNSLPRLIAFKQIGLNLTGNQTGLIKDAEKYGEAELASLTLGLLLAKPDKTH